MIGKGTSKQRAWRDQGLLVPRVLPWNPTTAPYRAYAPHIDPPVIIIVI